LFTHCNLLEKLMEVFNLDENKRGTESGGEERGDYRTKVARKGYMGHVIIVSTAIVSACEETEEALRDVLEQISDEKAANGGEEGGDGVSGEKVEGEVTAAAIVTTDNNNNINNSNNNEDEYVGERASPSNTRRGALGPFERPYLASERALIALIANSLQQQQQQQQVLIQQNRPEVTTIFDLGRIREYELA